MNCITIAVEEAPKQSTAGLVVEVKAWKIVVVRKENKDITRYRLLCDDSLP